MNKQTKIILLILLSLCGLFLFYKLAEMFSPGTLGSFERRQFKVKKTDFIIVFDTLNERQIPEKWKETAMSIENTYAFIKENTCLYMKGYPEEMYFVSYNGNSKFTVISVRSVYKGGRWLAREKFDDREVERIENRFDEEIVKTIEEATGTKAQRHK